MFLRPRAAPELRPVLVALSVASMDVKLQSHTTAVERVAKNPLFERQLLHDINSFLERGRRLTENHIQCMAYDEKRHEFLVGEFPPLCKCDPVCACPCECHLDDAKKETRQCPCYSAHKCSVCQVHGNVQVYDGRGKWRRTITLARSHFSSDVCPVHMRVDSETSTLVVADSLSCFVFLYHTMDGKRIRTIGPLVEWDLYKMSYPQNAVMHPINHRVFVTDPFTRSVQVFDANGDSLFSMDIKPFTGLLYLAIDSRAEEVYATGNHYGRMYVFSTDGEFRRSIGFDQRDTDDLELLHNFCEIYVHPVTSDILVRDRDIEQLHVFRRDGQLLKSLPCQTTCFFPVGTHHVAILQKDGRIQVESWSTT